MIWFLKIHYLHYILIFPCQTVEVPVLILKNSNVDLCLRQTQFIGYIMHAPVWKHRGLADCKRTPVANNNTKYFGMLAL